RTMQKIGSTIIPLYAGTLGGWTGTSYAQINALTSNPVGTEGGLVVRNIPSGTQTVAQALLGASDNPDVTVNHAGTLPVDVSDRVARLLGRLNGQLSAGNSSTALLGISGVFTGAFEDVTDYAAITISVFADQ